ncbi:MAG: DUF4340 domain-containing protein [Clostridiales bacterium]|jgi:hypothetical protein|nr:DUF4340 domain-containing protein [Clostridiales bacterium]
MKKIVSLVVCVVLLGGLTGAYLYLLNKNDNAEPDTEETPVEAVPLLDMKEFDLKQVSFYSEGGELTLSSIASTPTPVPTPVPADEEESDETGEEPDVSAAPTPTPEPIISWEIAGMEDLPLNKSNVSEMVRGAYALTAAEKISGTVDNPAEYGLDPPKARAVAAYYDGTEKTIQLGATTPNGDYYYMMLQGDPALYLVASSVGAPFSYTLDSLIDKALPAIDAQSLQYVYIHEKNREPLEFSGAQTETGQYALTLARPYSGRQLHAEDFQANVLNPMSGIVMGELTDLNPSDLAAYGLDDPLLEVRLIDSGGETHLLAGADRDDEAVYVKYADRPSVFAMNKTYLSGFYTIDVFSFIDRYAALINIEDCDAVAIESASARYDVQIVHETVTPPALSAESPAPDGDDPDAAPTPTPEPEKVIHPSVNGQAMQEDSFRKYYETLIGLSYDAAIENFEPSGLPDLTVAYQLSSGAPNPTYEYYTYNEDFYAVRENGGSIEFVINKRSADQMLLAMEKLLAGQLEP